MASPPGQTIKGNHSLRRGALQNEWVSVSTWRAAPAVRACLCMCGGSQCFTHTLYTVCITLTCLQNELPAITALQTPLSQLIPIITTVLNPLLPVATASAGGSALTSRAHEQFTLLPRGDWINDYPRPVQPHFCFLGFHFPLGVTKRQGSVCLGTGVTGIFCSLLRVSLPAGVVQVGAASFFWLLHYNTLSSSAHRFQQ